MTTYLLDTTTLINFARNEPREVEWLTMMLNSGERLGICPIVVAECFAGAHEQERPGWREIIGALEMWPITTADAELAGTWRYGARRNGRTLQTSDALIAAVAFRMQAILVTDNVRDFEQVTPVRLLRLSL